MGNEDEKDEWLTIREDGSAPDISREEAAYQREKERLLREGHLGKIAVCRFDEVVGVYDDIDKATIAAHERFGWGRMIFREITAHDEPEWMSNFDPNHPSARKID